MNKKEKIILICFALCIIIVLGLFIRIMYDSKFDDSIDGRTAENQLLLSGIGVFSEKYTGTLKSSEIMQKLQELTKKDIPDLYKDIKKYDDTKLEEYYENNKSSINDKFGKTNFEEFKEFAKSIQNIDTNLNNWYSLNIDRNSFVNSSERTSYAYVEYEVKFENEDILKFSVYISNKTYVTPNFIIDIKSHV